MEKKPPKITSNVNKPKKNNPRGSFDRAVLHAIQRRITKNDGMHLYDESLPDDVRFSGLISRNPKLQTPRVDQTQTAELSPFILELRTEVQTPTEILTEDSYAPILLNFLSTSFLAPETNSVQAVDTSHDLILSRDDIKSPSKFSPSFSLANLSHTLFPIRTERSLESVPLQLSQAANIFSSESFLPKHTPENLLSYFDLPEDDVAQEDIEGETDELFELIDIIDSAEEDTPVITKPSFQWPKFSFLIDMPNGWQRAIGAFVLVSFAFVLPLHAMQVLNQLRDAKSTAQSSGEQALASLKAAAGASLVTNPASASASFTKAGSQFGQADQAIKQLGGGVRLLLSTLGPTKQTFKTNTALLTMGEELSIAGSRVSDGLTAMQQELNPTPSSRIQLLTLYLQSALPHLVAAETAMSEVDLNVIDDENKDTFAQLQISLPALVKSTGEFLSLSDTIQSILGTNGTKHYLLIFQNNTEIRPTGGFMGSFAELSVHNGIMDQLTIPGGGTYDLQGQQRTPLVSPWPLQLLSAKWQFQDANWFPDFPTSARQMIQFYKDSGGADVDGVIAINANFVTDLLGLLGPIEMPDYGRTIDQDNFLSETQKIVETEYDKDENKPKAFIGDLAPKLIDKALHESPETFLDLANHINAGLSQKEIQLYFSENALEKTIQERGWSGEVKATDKDYLMVIDTNLGGGKTDLVMEEIVDVEVNIDAQGLITNTVKISRTNNGVKGEMFTGVNNVNFLRLYVPNNSKLLSADGFNIPSVHLFEEPDPDWIVDPDLQYADDTFSIHQESGTQIYKEDGKTVFGNWTQTKPGETTLTQFTYTLPFSLSDLFVQNTTLEKIRSLFGVPMTNSYSLLVQKQSGVTNRTTTVRLHIPDSLHALWSSTNLSHIQFTNVTDGFLGILFESAL